MKGLADRLLPYALAFFSSLCIMVLELVASRLVGQHVGMSLSVWTCVIGVILGGICLGNVLGGRLADRAEPRKVLGPLYALGAALTLATLGMNALMGLVPSPSAESPLFLWDVRTIVIVTLDFLVPATVLGMISPTVAKIAVEQAARSGSAIGDVYFWGAIGSILGTFLAGFWLIYMAPTSIIVVAVAAALALLGAAMSGRQDLAALGLLPAFVLGLVGLATAALGFAVSWLAGMSELGDILVSAAIWVGIGGGALATLGLLAAAFAGPTGATLPGVIVAVGLGASCIGQVRSAVPNLSLGSTPMNVVTIAGAVLALVSALLAVRTLRAVTASSEGPAEVDQVGNAPPVRLRDLAALAFIASLGFMALEMVAGRLVQRHLGSSVYNWTSVIGVLLGGLSLGNLIGGKIADRVHDEKQASWLFMAASMLTLTILLLERKDMLDGLKNFVTHWGDAKIGSDTPHALISDAIEMKGYPWWFRVLSKTTVVFFLPAISMGTVSPIVAKLAVDRVKRSKRTGTAIGQVYAWGMVGSILGTFLTGFVLIDLLGTKGVLLAITALMALSATFLGSIVHAAWAGIPLGLLAMSLLPLSIFQNHRLFDFIREERGNAGIEETGIAYADESNYYYIKVENDPYVPRSPDPDEAALDDGQVLKKRTLVLDNLIHGYFLLGHPEHIEYDYEFIYAQVAHRVAVAKAKAAGQSEGQAAPLRTMFLGGGAYTFPRYLQHKYAGTSADVAEIDPGVTKANRVATGFLPEVPPYSALERTPEGQPFLRVDGVTIKLGPAKWPTPADFKDKDTASYEVEKERAEAEAHLMHSELEKSSFPTVKTTFGDARQFVERRQGRVKYDLIFGDAFNDFSVPWHLTTREFNEKLADLLAEDGVYMINIIDVYKSDRKAVAQGLADAEYKAVADTLREKAVPPSRCEGLAKKLVNALDDARLGVATWPIARAVATEFADDMALDAPDQAKVLEALKRVAEVIRGDKASMLDVVTSALQGEAELGKASIDELANAVVAREERFGQDQESLARVAVKSLTAGRYLGGFLSSWVETARLTFPHVYVFGTDDPPGAGLRETFVVAVSRQPLDVEDIGGRPGEPKFFLRSGKLFETRPYGDADLKALKVRARGITLTDDYAPVENLLAPVAATRGED
jgi:MFS family permease